MTNLTFRLKTAQSLLEGGVPVTIIPDSSVALIMADVDMVLVGAVGVVENGGILNQVRQYHTLRPAFITFMTFQPFAFQVCESLPNKVA